jgi:hypothetical protein
METETRNERSNTSDDTPDLVAVDTYVDLELIGQAGVLERLTLAIVPDHKSDFAAGRLGVGTPLAQAILGQPAGSTVPYQKGDIVEVKILTVTERMYIPTDDTVAQRQAVIQKAVSKSDQANAVGFALAVENKWGDYDPEAIEENWNDEE